jgi:hypothetical protein
MALSASDVFHLTADKLRQVARYDRCERLADHIKSNMMQTVGDEDVTQTSVPTDLVHNVVEPVTHNFCDSSNGDGDSQTQVLVELLHKVSPLSLEEPEAILRLSFRLQEVHHLGLVDNRVFVIRILPSFR